MSVARAGPDQAGRGRPFPRGGLAIEAERLEKRFGGSRALAGVDLAVAPGTVYGLLGPNGAGKTTTVRILATLLAPDAGRARVAGDDVAAEPHLVRRAIALAGQSATVDEDLTGRENLVFLGRLAACPAPRRRPGRPACWPRSGWSRPRPGRPGPIPGACAAGWTWPPA